MKKTTLTISATVAILFVTGITFTSATSVDNNGFTEENTQEKELYTVSPAVPREVMFSDEKIQLTLQNRHERMDREIMSFTYSHINTMLQIKRANRLFPIIEPVLKECGVPDDFKYLMIIESNGDIEARSPAGAGGLWQFMEKTGREYGLEVNKEVDERYHIEKATRAACAYLKESYSMFGDCLTVAASYNTGRANVTSRIENQKESKAIDLMLLPETSRYIFRLLAAKTIFSNPKEYGFNLRCSDLYPLISHKNTIVVDSAVACWGTFAKDNGTTYLQLREANPWIRGTSLTNKNRKKYNVNIPDTDAQHYDPQQTKAHCSDWVIE